jgi:ABC-type multidrug transport system ATPase subunit
MLALSRCFLADPKVVLLDEVSMGLAPRIIDEIFEALIKLRSTGVSLLLVEQYVSRALQVADQVYLLGRGQITFSGTPSQLTEDELMQQYVRQSSPHRPDSMPGVLCPEGLNDLPATPSRENARVRSGGSSLLVAAPGRPNREDRAPRPRAREQPALPVASRIARSMT